MYLAKELDENHRFFDGLFKLNGKVHTDKLVSTFKDNKEIPRGLGIVKGIYKNGKIHSVHKVCYELITNKYYGITARAIHYEGRSHRDEGPAHWSYHPTPEKGYWFVHGVNMTEIYDELI